MLVTNSDCKVTWRKIIRQRNLKTVSMDWLVRVGSDKLLLLKVINKSKAITKGN